MTKKTFEVHGKSIIEHVPLGRMGIAEDIAGTCIYLASKAGAYTNGTLISVDGGSLCVSKL